MGRDTRTPDEVYEDFIWALDHQQPVRWRLEDDGTSSTVLECVECGHRETFQTRDDARFWLEDKEECELCAYEEGMSQIGD